MATSSTPSTTYAPKSVQVRFNVTQELHDAMTEVANRHDVPVAHVIRHALRDYLKGQVTK